MDSASMRTAVRKIFVLKTDALTGQYTKLHNSENS